MQGTSPTVLIMFNVNILFFVLHMLCILCIHNFCSYACKKCVFISILVKTVTSTNCPLLFLEIWQLASFVEISSCDTFWRCKISPKTMERVCYSNFNKASLRVIKAVRRVHLS